jgi:hypothetical protein
MYYLIHIMTEFNEVSTGNSIMSTDTCTTIVSAFLTNINTFMRNSKSEGEGDPNKIQQIEKYIEYGRKLLEIDVPKIIFIEKSVYDEYLKEYNYETKQTQFVFINKTDAYLYEYRDKLTNFKINTTNNTKDTVDYMFVQCNKTEWMRTATEINHFSTEQFVWIDFGIYHIFNNDNEGFKNLISGLHNKRYNHIRIASIWNMNSSHTTEKYNTVMWYFAGGVFGGNGTNIRRFADLMKSKCIEIMETELLICWEVNIWYLIYREHPELFDCYYADHNKRILENY